MLATEKARKYAQTPLGIRPAEYGAYLDGHTEGFREASERVSELEGLIRDLLRDVACDWYVKHFRAGLAANPHFESGVVAEITNQELEQRAVAIFSRLREAVTDAGEVREP